MQRLLILFCSVVLVACGSTPDATSSSMGSNPALSPSAEPTTAEEASMPTPPPHGLERPVPAPELANETWLNSEPLTLTGLREQGKVALVEFWTYSCYNCVNVLPALRGWHETYASQGLAIVGVHYPEFDYERDIQNVEQALVDLDVKYPVAIDNDGKTWRAYRQRAWPTLYLVDKNGNIRYTHIGEGAYDTTEQWIKYLLAEEASPG